MMFVKAFLFDEKLSSVFCNSIAKFDMNIVQTLFIRLSNAWRCSLKLCINSIIRLFYWERFVFIERQLNIKLCYYGADLRKFSAYLRDAETIAFLVEKMGEAPFLIEKLTAGVWETVEATAHATTTTAVPPTGVFNLMFRAYDGDGFIYTSFDGPQDFWRIRASAREIVGGTTGDGGEAWNVNIIAISPNEAEAY